MYNTMWNIIFWMPCLLCFLVKSQYDVIFMNEIYLPWSKRVLCGEVFRWSNHRWFLVQEALDTADKKSPFAGALPGKAPAKGTHECLPYSSYSSRLAPGIAAGGGIFAWCSSGCFHQFFDQGRRFQLVQLRDAPVETEYSQIMECGIVHPVFARQR